MKANKSGSIRKTLTGILAGSALLGVYALGTLAVSGVVLTSATTDANAQRGRGGRGGGRGWGRGGGRGRGFSRGVAPALCHRPWSSRRVYCS
jgi:hypothetical protein